MTMISEGAARRLQRGLSVAAVALAGITDSAEAATVTFSNTVVEWFDPQGTAAALTTVVYTGNLTNDAQVRWGDVQFAGQEQSGYRFETAGNSISTVLPPSTPFTIGTFTHYNLPVFNALSGVSLRLTSDISVDGVEVGSRSFEYDFVHNETPNIAPCAFGGNVNPCADSVTIESSPSSQMFSVAGVDYTLGFSAFSIGGVQTAGFISPESGTNVAELRAVVTTVAPVPEPAVWATMMLGFGVAGGVARRRKERAPRAGAA